MCVVLVVQRKPSARQESRGRTQWGGVTLFEVPAFGVCWVRQYGLEALGQSGFHRVTDISSPKSNGVSNFQRPQPPPSGVASGGRRKFKIQLGAGIVSAAVDSKLSALDCCTYQPDNLDMYHIRRGPVFESFPLDSQY